MPHVKNPKREIFAVEKAAGLDDESAVRICGAPLHMPAKPSELGGKRRSRVVTQALRRLDARVEFLEGLAKNLDLDAEALLRNMRAIAELTFCRKLVANGGTEPEEWAELQTPDSDGLVVTRVQELRAELARKAPKRTAWGQVDILIALLENAEAAKRGVPIMDRSGRPTGEYRPDHAAVNRALELYGKQLGMFKETILTGSAEDRALDAMDDKEVAVLREAYDTIQKMRTERAEREASESGTPEEDTDSSRVH